MWQKGTDEIVHTLMDSDVGAFSGLNNAKWIVTLRVQNSNDLKLCGIIGHFVGNNRKQTKLKTASENCGLMNTLNCCCSACRLTTTHQSKVEPCGPNFWRNWIDMYCFAASKSSWASVDCDHQSLWRDLTGYSLVLRPTRLLKWSHLRSLQRMNAS